MTSLSLRMISPRLTWCSFLLSIHSNDRACTFLCPPPASTCSIYTACPACFTESSFRPSSTDDPRSFLCSMFRCPDSVWAVSSRKLFWVRTRLPLSDLTVHALWPIQCNTRLLKVSVTFVHTFWTIVLNVLSDGVTWLHLQDTLHQC